MKILLHPRAPYSFELEWVYHFSSKPQPDIYENQEWRRAIQLGKKLVPVAVHSVGSVEKPKLVAKVFTNLNIKEKEQLIKILNNIFNVHNKNKELYKVMDADPLLKPVKEKLYGLTPPHLSITIFEGVVKAILQQQLALNVAFMMTELLIRNFGDKVTADGKDFWAFPAAEKLASVRFDKLQSKCKLSQRKTEYIQDFAKEIVNGYDTSKLWDMSDDEAIEELTKFRGIGRWTAELLLVATMKRPHAIPAADLGIRRTFGRKFFNKKSATEEEVRQLSKIWGEFQDSIAFYLLCEEHYDRKNESLA